MCVYMHHLYVGPMKVRETSDSQELELEVIVSLYVDAGT